MRGYIESFVQDLKLALKRIIFLLSLVAGRSGFRLVPYVHSYLPGLTLEIEGLLSQRC